MTAPKRDKKPGRQALLVLGMHRSGTSAVSGVLTHLGAQAPRTVMPPTENNPRGYWESVELMRLHDQVLSAAGSRWNDWGEFNPEWMDSTMAPGLNGMLVEAIAKEYGSAPLFVVKDPRICRFFPLWLEALRGAKITPKVVIPVRHPLDVAKSLELRDHFGRSRSLLLWLRHVLDAEASSRSVARTFVLYENVLDDWRAQARKIATQLDIVWPKWSGDTEAKIEDFLTEDLRHHATRDARIPGDRELSEWTGTVYRILLDADKKSLDKAALDTLDTIRAEFNRTSGMYAAVVREHQTRVEGVHAQMSSQLSSKTLECEGLAAKQVELLRKLADGDKALAERTDEVKGLSERVEGERAEMLRVRELEDARRSLLNAETKLQLARTTGEFEALKVRLGFMQETLANNQKLREEHRSLTEELGGRLKACEAEYSQSKAHLEGQIHDLASQIEARNTEHAGVKARLERQLEAVTAELTERQRELETQREASARLDGQVEALTAELTNSEQELARAEAQLVALSEQCQASDHDVRRLQSLNAAAADEFESRKVQAAADHRAQRETLTAQVNSLRAENGAVRADKDALKADSDELKTKLERSTAELEQQRTQLSQATNTIEAMEMSSQQRFREIAKLTEMVLALEQSEEECAEREREHERLARENARELALSEYDTAVVQAQNHSLLNALAKQESTTIGKRMIDKFARTHAGRVLRIGSDSPKDGDIVLSSFPGGFDRNVEMLRNSPLFDAPWYLAQHDDVREHGADPLHHYLLFGAQEGRNPGPYFDTVDYLVRYPDVRHSALNPLVHYLEYGQAEGREATPPLEVEIQ